MTKEEQLPADQVAFAKPDRVLIGPDGCEVHYKDKIYVFFILGETGELIWDVESDDWREPRD